MTSERNCNMADTQVRSREHWYKHNKEVIWKINLGPIQDRLMAICNDKRELARKLMDSQDEYFKYCRATKPDEDCGSDSLAIRGGLGLGPDPYDESSQDPTRPIMYAVRPFQHSLLLEGVSREGGGTYKYLQARYDGGPPETRYCSPPTSNSIYAWKLGESIQKAVVSTVPRKSYIGPDFYRARGVLRETDFGPYRFP